MLVSLFAMSGCSDDIDSPIVTVDEYPRILGRWPDKQEDGTLGIFETSLNKTLVCNIPLPNFVKGYGILTEEKYIAVSDWNMSLRWKVHST